MAKTITPYVVPASAEVALTPEIVDPRLADVEALARWLAYAFDREDKRELWLLPTQRICYRQIMYIVVWRSLLRAIGGAGQAWGKLKRTGAVHIKDPVLP